jgi:hypothetical protein
VTEEEFARALDKLSEETLDSLRDRIRKEVMARPTFAGRTMSAAMSRLIEAQFRREAVLLAESQAS